MKSLGNKETSAVARGYWAGVRPHNMSPCVHVMPSVHSLRSELSRRTVSSGHSGSRGFSSEGGGGASHRTSAPLPLSRGEPRLTGTRSPEDDLGPSRGSSDHTAGWEACGSAARGASDPWPAAGEARGSDLQTKLLSLKRRIAEARWAELDLDR